MKKRKLYMSVVQLLHYGNSLPCRDDNGRPKQVMVGNVLRGELPYTTRRYELRMRITDLIEERGLKGLAMAHRTRHYRDVYLGPLVNAGLSEEEAHKIIDSCIFLLAPGVQKEKKGKSNQLIIHYQVVAEDFAKRVATFKSEGGEVWKALIKPSNEVVMANALEEAGLSDEDDDPDVKAERKEILAHLPGWMTAENISGTVATVEKVNELRQIRKETNAVPAAPGAEPSDKKRRKTEEKEEVTKEDKKKDKEEKEKKEKSKETKRQKSIMTALFPDNASADTGLLPPLDIALLGNMPQANVYRHVQAAMNNIIGFTINPLHATGEYHTARDTIRDESTIVPNPTYHYDGVFVTFDQLDHQQFADNGYEAGAPEIDLILSALLMSKAGARKPMSGTNTTPYLIMIMLTDHPTVDPETAFLKVLDGTKEALTEAGAKILFDYVGKRLRAYNPQGQILLRYFEDLATIPAAFNAFRYEGAGAKGKTLVFNGPIEEYIAYAANMYAATK